MVSQLDKNKKYTLEEFLNYVKEEERAELYEGTPVFMAPTSYEHEGVIAKLISKFDNATGNSCLVFGSNLQVIFPFNDENKGKDDVTVMPDISIVCDKSKLRNKRCYGAPDLVVEVLSPSTARNDRLLKLNYYEKAGVREYLIVDHQNRMIEKYVLNEGSYQSEDVYSIENETFISTIFPDVTYYINDIFSFLDEF